MTYTAPPSLVVYDQDPARGALLQKAGGGVYRNSSDPSVGFVGKPPECWKGFEATAESMLRSSGPIVFLHERSFASGENRLLSVIFDGCWGRQIVKFDVGIYRNAGNGGSSEYCAFIPPSQSGSLRLF